MDLHRGGLPVAWLWPRLPGSTCIHLQRMTAELSENTKAILLLAAPLIIGKHEANGVRILSGAKYNQCARCRREINLQPADLLSAKGEKATGKLLRQRFDIPRLRQLLGRGFQLSQA